MIRQISPIAIVAAIIFLKTIQRVPISAMTILITFVSHRGTNTVTPIKGSPRKISVSFAVILLIVWLFLGYCYDNLYPHHHYVYSQ